MLRDVFCVCSSLEERHQKWVEVEGVALRQQVGQLQEKLRRHLDKEKVFREDNARLRKRSVVVA